MDASQVGTSGLPSAAAYVQGLVTTAISHCEAATVTVNGASVPSNMPAADTAVFVGELNLLQEQLNTSAVFSVADITTQISAITTRLDRAAAFAYDLYTQGARVPDGQYSAEPTSLTVGGTTYDASQIAQAMSGQLYIPIQDASGNLVGDLRSLLLSLQTPSSNGIALPADNSTTTTSGTYQYPGQATGASYTATYTFTQTAGEPASLDNNAGIANGYTTFLTQEKEILKLAQDAYALAQPNAVLAGTRQNLDVPNLIYLFMLYANLTGEAEIQADTEEVNQTNALLQLYSQMQNIINQTVGSYGSDNTQTRPLQGSSGIKDKNGNTYLTAQEIAVVKLFTSGDPAPVPNPIEIMKGIGRTTSDTGGFITAPDNDPGDNYTSQGSTENDQLSLHWSNYGTSLSDTVNTLNQDSQIKMNDIDSETKQKDREFDLANNALSKMSDIVQQIANTVGQ